MAYREFDSLDWVSKIFTQNENFGYFTIDKIKNQPRKWLCTLPMFEYAHVMTCITAFRCGGRPEKYVEELHKKRLMPILEQWYNHLAEYRFHRALLMMNFDDLKKTINDMSIKDEMKCIKCHAIKTRRRIREICAAFEAEQLHNNPTQTP